MRGEKSSLKIRVRYPYYTVNVKKGYYMDSIQLLKISEEVKKVPGVLEALIAMGTDTNKELLKMLGFSYEDLNVTPNDLIIAIGAESEDALKNAVNTAERLLEEGIGETREYYADLDTALSKNPDISIALISIPGQYVKDVAMKLIDRGINLHIFSDNVPINDEIEIKKRALEKNVLVLGPGAGTVIIKGVGLGFANKVNVGSVGIVAASGTGLQEISSLLSEIGIGISYGLGVGGNDVKNAIGGIMTIKALEFLQNDDDTKVLALISKVPDRETEEKILNYIYNNVSKPIIINFLGGHARESAKGNVYFTYTLHQTILKIAKVISENKYVEARNKYLLSFDELIRLADELKRELSGSQRFIRGLFTGGSFVNETLVILRELVNDLYSNAPIEGVAELKNPFKSIANSIIDLGDEVFTRGRPHPMIDPTIRVNRLLEEANYDDVAVILMDFVLGYGSHDDPVGAHADAIKHIMESSKGKKVIIAHVCGTSEDPQNVVEQVNKLRSLGVIVMPTNALAAFLAGLIVTNKSIEKLKYVYDSLIEV